jgi:hypothetical protein
VPAGRRVLHPSDCRPSSGLDRNIFAIVVDMEAISLATPWCTWYKNPWFALHEKCTHHG